MTQFGRMCAKLGIGIIAASSPQAKGRVERAHGTHQDRLVKKLRLIGIASYDQANAYLDEHYLVEHNRRYAHAAVAKAATGAGAAFVAISPDGSTAYSVNNGANTVSVIRTGDNTLVNTINVATGPYGSAVSPGGPLAVYRRRQQPHR